VSICKFKESTTEEKVGGKRVQNWADALGSCFEQEKLLALDEEETEAKRTRKNAPKYILLLISKRKISVSEAHSLSSFPTSFQRFSLKFGENVGG